VSDHKPLKLPPEIEDLLEAELLELKQKLGFHGSHIGLLAQPRDPRIQDVTAFARTIGFVTARFHQLAKVSLPLLIDAVMDKVAVGEHGFLEREISAWVEAIRDRVLAEARAEWDHRDNWFDEVAQEGEAQNELDAAVAEWTQKAVSELKPRISEYVRGQARPAPGILAPPQSESIFEELTSAAGGFAEPPLEASAPTVPTIDPAARAVAASHTKKAERSRLLLKYKKAWEDAGVKKTDEMIAQEANPRTTHHKGWNTRDPIRKWLRVEARYEDGSRNDCLIRKVLSRRSHKIYLHIRTLSTLL